MQYYILHTDNRELVQISISEYFAHLVTKNEESLLLIYNPITGEVKSLEDISEYWFHDFNGKLEEVAHSSADEAKFYLDLHYDFGKETETLDQYKFTINNQTQYSLAEYQANQ